jgi:hypothetical protein
MEHVEDKFNDAGAWTEDDTLSREIVDAMYQVYGGGKWQVASAFGGSEQTGTDRAFQKLDGMIGKSTTRCLCASGCHDREGGPHSVAG